MIELLNAKTGVLNSNKYSIEIAADEIIAVTTNDRKITLNDVITVDYKGKNSNFKINNIKERDNKIYIDHVVPNMSNTFLLPMLCTTYMSIGFPDYLMGCYCGIEDKYTPDRLYLLYRFVPTETMLEIEETLMSNSKYLYSEKIDDKLLFTFRMPNEEEAIIRLFIQGKFSLFPEGYKRKLMYFFNGDKETLRQILYKDKNLRNKLEEELGCVLYEDAELANLPNPLNEILNYDKI